MISNFRHAWWGLFAALVVAPLANTVLASGSPLDTDGFEGYPVGPLISSHGWVGVDQGGGSTNVSAGAEVQTTIALQAQSVKVERVGGVDNHWAVPFGGTPPVLPSNRFLLVDWDMYVVGTGLSDGRLGPFFGIEAYDDQGTFGRLGGLGVDATTSEVLFLHPDNAGAYLSSEANQTVELEQWNHFAMLFDFSIGRYSAYVNGSRIALSIFADPGVNQFTDADIAAMAAAADTGSQNLPGTAYFDNLRALDIAAIPGDFDLDGDVDSTDLGIWKSAYHMSANGDADGDGDSDGNDFIVWQRNLGLGLPGGVAAVSAVPEPAVQVLAAIAALVGMHRRRRSA